jgi:hypothetical protein
VIRSTFRLVPGIGPWLESRLWSAGITRWEALPAARPETLPPRLDARLRPALASAAEALSRRDAGALAAMLPRSERWRLHGAFASETAYLDVETDGEVLTAVGVLDANGPRLFLRGRDLDRFPEAAGGWKVLATYNGLAFDLPVLRRAFPGWRPPAAHVDLRPLWARLGHRGGLKALEEACGRPRPPHLGGLRGRDAVRLWRRHLEGDAGALRLFAEYNLYDAVNLRTLLDLGYNRMIERLRLPAPTVPVSERGDVLYDVTRIVLALR